MLLYKIMQAQFANLQSFTNGENILIHLKCTSAWTSNPEGGCNEGRVAAGGSLPGQTHIIPSCSEHGNDFIFTSSNRVDGIFSHFPSVEYSHPDILLIQELVIHSCHT